MKEWAPSAISEDILLLSKGQPVDFFIISHLRFQKDNFSF